MTKAKNLEDLQNRWSFMCEGIEDDYIRNATMMVLENSANYMVDNDLTEESVMNEILDEATSNPNVSQADYQGTVGDNAPRKGVANYVVPKVMLPVIRRVMPQLIAHELVSVQPIQGKTGVIFYAEYQYSDGKGGVLPGQAFTGNYPQDLVAGANLAGQAFYSSQKLGPYTVDGNGTTAIAITEPFAKTTMTYISAEFYPVAGGAAVAGTVSVTVDGTIDVTPAAALDAGTGNYICFVKYQQEASAAIPEMQFQIMSKSVETVERKLKIRFTR